MPRSINPTPQFLDDAGNPLVNGKMFFFESGTSTPKATFADINLTIPNTNPVILTGDGRMPNVWFNGVVRQKLTDSDDVQIFDKDPVGDQRTGADFEEWVPQVIYSVNDIVEGSDGNFYLSFTNGNENNDPTTSPAFWQEIEFITIWNPNVNYGLGATVKASDNTFYRSLIANNLNNDPISSPTEWGSPIILDLSNPGPIGDGTPSTAAFTTVTADGMDLNAIAVIQKTSATFVAVATWHPAMDEHSGWFDQVNGARSIWMDATVRVNGTAVLEVWDKTVTPNVILQTVTIAGVASPTSVSFLGGVIAVGSEDGIDTFGWGVGGFGRLRNYATPFIASNDVVDVSLGYTNQPSQGEFGPIPSIAYAAGGFPGVIRDDGQNFNIDIALDAKFVSWMNGKVLWARIGAANVVYSTTDPQLMTGNVGVDWTDDPITNGGASLDILRMFGGVTNDLAASKNLMAIAQDAGLVLVPISAQKTGGVLGLSSTITVVNYSGWMPRATRGAWLTNDGPSDRSSYTNTLTENGTVPQQSADGATGEVQSYGPFSALNFFRQATNSDFQFSTNISFTLLVQFNSAGNTSNEVYLERRNPALTGAYWRLRMNTNGTIEGTVFDGTNVASVTSPITYDDGKDHLAVLVFNTAGSGPMTLFVDREPVATADTAAIGDLDDANAEINIGIESDDSSPALTTTLSLCRVVARNMTADEIRYIYDTELRMFDTGAVVTLPGAAAAVQAVAIDPVSEDIYVGQVDALSRWNGLVLEDTRLVADPELWTSNDIESLAAVAGGLSMITAAEAYSEIPVRDVRDASEKTIVVPGVGGVDLSVVKAFGHVSSGVAAILSSFNIKSVDDVNVGHYRFNFAIPFIDANFVVNLTVYANTSAGADHMVSLQTKDFVEVKIFNNAAAQFDAAMSISCLGQLEGE